MEAIFEAVLANEIVRLLLAAGATLADTGRHGTAVADRINSQALRHALHTT